jgi:hypothetical protein
VALPVKRQPLTPIREDDCVEVNEEVPQPDDEPTVPVPRSEWQELLSASHRNAALAYAGGSIAVAAALTLAISEGGFVLWVGVVAILGVALLAWGVRTSRRVTRRYGPLGRPHQASPYGAFDGWEGSTGHLVARPYVEPSDRLDQQ